MNSLALIVAMAENGVIGRGKTLPWHLPDDLKRFKTLTMGHPIVMGRTTHESIGRALPGRPNLVVTSRRLTAPGCEGFSSLETALGRAWELDAMPFIIGGARLYEEALPQVSHLYLTKVPGDIEGDTFFPKSLRLREWRTVREEMGAEGVRYIDAMRDAF